MYIIIGADIVPTRLDLEFFCSGQMDKVVSSEICSLLNMSKHNIFNLEIPLTDRKNEIKKWGPCFIAPCEAVNGLKSLNIQLVTLANNHIYDQSASGMLKTCETLKNNNIKYIGVGNTIEDASKPYVFYLNEKKIGVYACVENEFSVITNQHPGANPFDPLNSLDHIQMLRRECDYVIVLYHGGKEYYQYPSPNLQRICRKIVEKGANIVICQHSHCIGCKEEYMDGTIVYGQGNFLFGSRYNELWGYSLLLKINELFQIQYIPVALHESGFGIFMPEESTSKRIMDGFFRRSEEIKEKLFLEDQYQLFAKSQFDSVYLRALGGKPNFLERILDKATKGKLKSILLRHRYSNKELLRIRNYIECESQRELLLKGIASYELTQGT